MDFGGFTAAASCSGSSSGSSKKRGRNNDQLASPSPSSSSPVIVSPYKRARFVSSHPLSRSPTAATGFMQSQSFPLPLRSGVGHYTSPLALATGMSIGGYGQPASVNIKCAACQRSPTSTLAASKFKRCILCKASACAVCVRTCSQQGGCKGVVCSKCAVESPQGLSKCHACLSKDSSSDSSIDSATSSNKGEMEQDTCMHSNSKLDNWHINDYDFSNTN